MNPKLLQLYVQEHMANRDANGLIKAITLNEEELKAEMDNYRKIVKSRLAKVRADADVTEAEVEGD